MQWAELDGKPMTCDEFLNSTGRRSAAVLSSELAPCLLCLRRKFGRRLVREAGRRVRAAESPRPVRPVLPKARQLPQLYTYTRAHGLVWEALHGAAA